MISGGTYTIWQPAQIYLKPDDGPPAIYTPAKMLHVRVYPERRDSEIGGQEQYVQFLNGPYGWVHEGDLENLLEVE